MEILNIYYFKYIIFNLVRKKKKKILLYNFLLYIFNLINIFTTKLKIKIYIK